jgi:multicomponent Na+:H+ antiporter subunit E
VSETEGVSGGIIVPLSDTATADETVRHAVDSADGGPVHFVFVVSDPRRGTEDKAETVLEKARVWAEEADPDASVSFEVLESQSYLFGPGEYADILTEYASENGIEHILLDPNYRVSATSPALQPLSEEIAGYDEFSVETADVERNARRPSLLTRGGFSRFSAVFALSYAFYLVLGSLSAFDLVTGGVTATVVSLTVQRVSFETSPSARRVPGLVFRLVLYVPYLLWQIVVANFRIAYVVLHPDLPIDPSVERFKAAVWGGAAVTTLANSITLTPGTLTVEADGREFHVHALTENAREGLCEGALERAVRFVFYGRRALDYPKPKEREKEEGGGYGD